MDVSKATRRMTSPRVRTGLFLLLLLLFVGVTVRTNSSHLALLSQLSSTIQSLENVNSSSNGVSFATTTTTSRQDLPTLHLMYGISGSKKDLFDELEVSLKSVLANAPLDAVLHIHVVVNQDAAIQVEQRLQQAGILGGSKNNVNATSALFRTRHPIVITIHNVERYTDTWLAMIQQKIRNQTMDSRVALGGYYRLLAYQVLQNYTIDPTVGVVYMDVDIVVMANLNDLVPYMYFDNHSKPTKQTSTPMDNANLLANNTNNSTAATTDTPVLLKASATWINSGFMVLNVHQFDVFWDRVDYFSHIPCGGDQCLVTLLKEQFPAHVGSLPTSWDTHLGHGWRPHPHDLLKKRPAVNMLHFTGIRAGSFFDNDKNALASYCQRVKSCRDNPVHQQLYDSTWGLVDYYIRLPWAWVKHHGSTRIPPGEQGHALQVVHVTH